MRKGHVLVLTLVLLIVASLFVVAILTNLSAYVKRVSLQSTSNLSHLGAQNLLQLSVAFVKPKFNGVRGVELPWVSGSVPDKFDWWERFKEWLFNESDGDYWRIFFEKVDESKYFDLSDVDEFREALASYGLSGSTVIVPIKGSYMVGANPYSVLVVSRNSLGKIESYAFAVLAIDFLNKYAYFTEKETRPGGSKIYFITQDVIDGPMRSNDTINIWGNPRFKSTVEVKGVNIESGSPIFEMGWKQLTQRDIDDYNINKIKLNYTSDLEALVKPMNQFLTSDAESGIKLNLKGKTIQVGNNTRTAQRLIVEFKSAQGQGADHFIRVSVEYREGNKTGIDDLFTIKPRDGRQQITIHDENARKWLDLAGVIPDNPSEYNKDVDFNGVLMSDLTIALTNRSNNDKPMYVDGRYTIYSKENVEIYDHIVYEDFRDLFPYNRIDGIVVDNNLVERMKNATRTDFLNIVADKYVLVKEKQRNLKITASIYSFDQSFQVEGYDQGSRAGQLTIFGSLMQYYRGPVGTFRRGRIQTGYYKNYIYDYKILEGISAIGTPAKREGFVLLAIRGIY
ncbi:MAG: hypothetical protein PWQ90_1625 [Pseudothermotoga sp.]|nr:hypothetical protein [Pseudothermotoga sp.]